MDRRGEILNAGSQAMRALCLITACLFALLAGPLDAHAQIGFDRPGGDYTSFPVRSGDPAACAARCEREGRCRAWSFSYPLTTWATAMCWLKSSVTARVENNCCISGVRGAAVAQPRNETVEFAIDRQGGDYKEITVTADPGGQTCKAACEADNKCRAWTYARPGYGSSARCFLKSEIKPPRRKPCCISGVVR
jgi:hypothetical protein